MKVQKCFHVFMYVVFKSVQQHGLSDTLGKYNVTGRSVHVGGVGGPCTCGGGGVGGPCTCGGWG